jgi:hypothetical protein
MFGPSVRVLRLTAFTPNLLRRLLTSAYASQHLPVSVARGTHADLPGYCAPTFTLMPVGFTPQPSVQVLGFDDFGHLTRLRRLVSASCSSGQRFAFGFLQIRSRPRHPCRSANSSPCRVSRGLSPPSECALPGAPKKAASFRRKPHTDHEPAIAYSYITRSGSWQRSCDALWCIGQLSDCL